MDIYFNNCAFPAVGPNAITDVTYGSLNATICQIQ